MSRLGPIIIIDDDHEDHELLEGVFSDLQVKNERLYFDFASKAIDFLKKTDRSPFLILSDINMPHINGIHLRQLILADKKLKKKSIPFIFFTTGTTKAAVGVAYDLTVQGFFIKPNSISDLKLQLDLIIKYWSVCVHPNIY